MTMNKVLWKLAEAPGKQRRKYKAFECAYRERREDIKKSRDVSIIDVMTKEEVLTNKINKAYQDAKILVVEYRTLGLNENLMPLRNIYENVTDMEKERHLLRKLRRMKQNEECRRQSAVNYLTSEHMLMKNLYRLKMKSKSSLKDLSKHAVKFEKGKDMMDTVNSDIHQALEHETEDECETSDEKGFINWMENMCDVSSDTCIERPEHLPDDDVLSERLNKLKLN